MLVSFHYLGYFYLYFNMLGYRTTLKGLILSAHVIFMGVDRASLGIGDLGSCLGHHVLEGAQNHNGYKLMFFYSLTHNLFHV